MSIPATSAYRTSGADLRGWYGDRVCGVIREKCSLTASSAFYTLKNQLPGNAKRVWAQISYGTAPAFAWAATHNSPTGAVVISDVAPTSVDATATTNILLQGSTTLTANTKVRGIPVNSKDTDTTTTAKTLYLYPFAATTSASNTNRFNINTTTATSGYNFSSTADVYVNVFYETFTEIPSV